MCTLKDHQNMSPQPSTMLSTLRTYDMMSARPSTMINSDYYNNQA